MTQIIYIHQGETQSATFPTSKISTAMKYLKQSVIDATVLKCVKVKNKGLNN